MKGYRTIALNILGAVLPFLESIDVTSFGPAAIAGYGLAMCGANILARFLTTTPVGVKQ